MNEDLHIKYRPKLFKHVLGQPQAVGPLKSAVERDKVPHSILFVGPPGCGKTTLAYIVKEKLGCGRHDFCEVNAANARGIETIRDIERLAGHSPHRGSKCRVWLIDECHQLTADAQSAALKLLEHPPDHAYFMLATSDASKIKKAILSRCTPIEVKLLDMEHLGEVVGRALKGEEAEIPSAVKEKIIQTAEGSARTALVLLGKVIGLKSEKEQLEAILPPVLEAQAIDIVRILVKPYTSKWQDLAELLKNVEEDPEVIRQIVLSYCTPILFSGAKGIADRAYFLVNAFRDPFYGSKKSNKALLTACCWDVFHRR